jgi:hypothetical protein
VTTHRDRGTGMGGRAGRGDDVPRIETNPAGNIRDSNRFYNKRRSRIEDAALFSEMLSLQNDGRCPAL